MRKRGAEIWAKWRELISDHARSGQSVAAFCRERGICAPHFFAWKRRLSQAAPGSFVEVRVVGATKAAPVAGAECPAIEVRLAGNRSLLVGPGFDADHLRALLAVLDRPA